MNKSFCFADNAVKVFTKQFKKWYTNKHEKLLYNI